MHNVEKENFVETCWKERGTVSIGGGADLLAGLAHFPLLLPKQVPVLLQRLLLLHHHHRDTTLNYPNQENQSIGSSSNIRTAVQ